MWCTRSFIRYRMCSCLRRPGGPCSLLGFDSSIPVVFVKESESAARYLPTATVRAAEGMMFFSSHSLHSCPRVPFSHHIIGSRCSLQTWIFFEEHCFNIVSSRTWKCVISARGIDIGSGRIMPAAKEALAMARA